MKYVTLRAKDKKEVGHHIELSDAKYFAERQAHLTGDKYFVAEDGWATRKKVYTTKKHLPSLRVVR